MAIFELYLYLSGDAFQQYSLVCLAQLTIVLCETLYFLREKAVLTKIICCGSCFVLVAFLCINTFRFMPLTVGVYKEYHEPKNHDYDILLTEIPENEKDSFVIYTLANELKDAYPLNDLLPCYKYFIIQEWHAGIEEKTKDDIYKTFADGNAKWILADNNTYLIEDILDSRYTIVDSSGDFSLYRLTVPLE